MTRNLIETLELVAVFGDMLSVVQEFMALNRSRYCCRVCGLERIEDLCLIEICHNRQRGNMSVRPKDKLGRSRAIAQEWTIRRVGRLFEMLRQASDRLVSARIYVK
jgi:hypothetical protein